MKTDKITKKEIITIILIAIILYCILQNASFISEILNKGFSALYPFIFGAGLAFVLNIPMSFYEKKLFKPKKIKGKVVQNRFKRAISIILAIITVAIILTLVIALIIPEIINAIKLIIINIPEYIEAVEDFLADISQKYPELKDVVQNIKIDEEKLQKSLIDLTGNVMTFSINTIKGLLSGIANTFIAIVFAVYILANKDRLKNQVKKLCYAYLQKENAQKFIKTGKLSKQTFKSFISGQVIEAVILGTLCAIGMYILKIPYAITISILVAFTALVPIVGAFLGGTVGALLIVTVDPIKALIFIIFLIILQQIEGNLIYPKVVGNSTGLPGMWVLFAITIGGGLLGVIGMLLAVPTISVIYTMIKKDTEEKLIEKDIKI